MKYQYTITLDIDSHDEAALEERARIATGLLHALFPKGRFVALLTTSQRPEEPIWASGGTTQPC